MVKKVIILWVCLIALGIINLEAKNCTTKKECLNNASCQCYCARKCGFRKKEAHDKPVYVKNDPRGYGCYCKQWDLDHVNECE